MQLKKDLIENSLKIENVSVGSYYWSIQLKVRQ